MPSEPSELVIREPHFKHSRNCLEATNLADDSNWIDEGVLVTLVDLDAITRSCHFLTAESAPQPTCVCRGFIRRRPHRDVVSLDFDASAFEFESRNRRRPSRVAFRAVTTN